jgi:hypothetical protein
MMALHLRHVLCAVPLILAAALALGSATGCGGEYVDVGGYEATYAPPPPSIERYPHALYAGEQVYDVDGRYYRKFQGRWVSYRIVPPEVSRWHEQNRGRAERQR